MDRPVELVPLICPQCATPIPAEPEEVAWVCRRCGKGVILNPDQGLEPLAVHYQAGLNPNNRGRPFWVVEAQVSLQRQTYSGNQSKEAEQYWSVPRRFFVPAFSTPLESLLALGPQMLLQPPVLQDGPRLDFEPVTLSVSDIQPLVEFIVVAVEAGRKDKLKGIQMAVKLSEPALWILS